MLMINGSCVGGSSDGEEVNQAMNRILMTLLMELDGLESTRGVGLVGCTTRPDLIDEALLRPGKKMSCLKPSLS